MRRVVGDMHANVSEGACIIKTKQWRATLKSETRKYVKLISQNLQK